jgi:hypothetical protein
MKVDLVGKGIDHRNSKLGQRRTTFKIDLDNLKLDKFKNILPVKNF